VGGAELGGVIPVPAASSSFAAQRTFTRYMRSANERLSHMRIPARTFCLSLIFVLATSTTLVAQSEKPEAPKDVQQQCLDFVQSFYD
jgi:hypothetical protein